MQQWGLGNSIQNRNTKGMCSQAQNIYKNSSGSRREKTQSEKNIIYKQKIKTQRNRINKTNENYIFLKSTQRA
jgi:hypothetical protein